MKVELASPPRLRMPPRLGLGSGAMNIPASDELGVGLASARRMAGRMVDGRQGRAGPSAAQRPPQGFVPVLRETELSENQ
jgi:hypothetical protein